LIKNVKNSGVTYIFNLGTRTEGNAEVWQFLERICCSNDFDDAVILSFLEALDIKPYQDCINICYDNAGAIYEIPNYCINDPYEYNIPTSKNKNLTEKHILVTVRKVIDDLKIECTNRWSVTELKSCIKKISDGEITKPENIRLFYGGREMQNSEQLWFYNIDNDSIIQLLYNCL
jgi:hypothetical protein